MIINNHQEEVVGVVKDNRDHIRLRIKGNNNNRDLSRSNSSIIMKTTTLRAIIKTTSSIIMRHHHHKRLKLIIVNHKNKEVVVMVGEEAKEAVVKEVVPITGAVTSGLINLGTKRTHQSPIMKSMITDLKLLTRGIPPITMMNLSITTDPMRLQVEAPQVKEGAILEAQEEVVVVIAKVLQKTKKKPKAPLNTLKKESTREPNLRALPILNQVTQLKLYWQLVPQMINVCGVRSWTRGRARSKSPRASGPLLITWAKLMMGHT